MYVYVGLDTLHF